tara:strand:+ start:353 stop:1129 length:777 start_codon:yes stop_codon:yes gene_type:complete
MSSNQSEGRTVLDSFEEKYVGFYRWLLLIIGIFSLLGFLALLASLGWSTTQTARPSSSDYFAAPTWTEIRREVLPLRMKLKEGSPAEEAPTRTREVPIDKRVRKLKENLLVSFVGEDREEASSYFPLRLLNEWLLVEVPVPAKWKAKLIDDLLMASVKIGADERITRISSIDGRSSVIMESIEAFVKQYLRNVERAESAAQSKQAEEEARKMAIAAKALAALPIAMGIFLSMIGLILLIRMELHLRKLSHDYRVVNIK